MSFKAVSKVSCELRESERLYKSLTGHEVFRRNAEGTVRRHERKKGNKLPVTMQKRIVIGKKKHFRWRCKSASLLEKINTSGGDALGGHTRSHPEHDG